MGDDIKVLSSTTEFAFDDRGKPIEQMRVEYKVGDHGPFYKRFPAADFNGLTARAALEAHARELRLLIG